MGKNKKVDSKIELIKKYRVGPLFYISPLLALVIGYYLGSHSFKGESTNSLTKRAPLLKFISPLLDCDDREADINTSFSKKLKGKIESTLDLLPTNYSVSVYFRDLYNGPTVLVNGNTSYSAASLSKIPIMIAYLKHAETYPYILEKEIIYNYLNSDYTVSYQPNKKLEDGKSYTVLELISRMISQSDNGARRLLIGDVFQNINNYSPQNAVHVNAYEEIMGQFIESKKANHKLSMIKVKEISSFFRVLFNATFLSKKYSNLALEILSETNFSLGLRSGISPDVTMSHKFGEMLDKVKMEKQLHDCGIIYHPSRPYILCILTKGSKSKELEKAISNISQIVSKEVINSLFQ